MRTLSTRVIIGALVAFLLTVGRVPVQANEFPSQPPARRPDLILKKGPAAEFRVLRAPNLVGMRVGDARGSLERAGLRSGRETQQPTTDATPGTVLRQDPAPGTVVKPRDAINVWIAAAPPRDDRRGDDVRPPPGPGGPPRPDRGPIAIPPDLLRFVVVPDLIGRPMPDAVDQIERHRLSVGQQRREESDAVAGTVVGQSPMPGRRVVAGTPVNVVVATPLRVTVPDLVGHEASEAFVLLERSRLRAGSQRREESDAAAGTVVSQAPSAGHRVPAGTPVSVVVASPILVTVPDVVGSTTAEAVARLERQRLGMGQQHREESEAAVGTIVRQAPTAGTRVPAGTAVDVVMASRVLVVVPDVTGVKADDARARLERSRLAAGRQGREESDAVAGTVVSQTPAAGKRVPVGTAVAFTVATPVMVAVPELTGRNARDAQDVLVEQQLVLGDSREEESLARRGSIVGQSPGAGTRVPRGTRVAITVAVAPPPPPTKVIPPSPAPPSPDSPRVPPRAPVTPPRAPIVTPPRTPLPAPPPSVVTPPPVAQPPMVATAPRVALPTERSWRHPATWSAATLLLLAGIAGVLYRSYGGKPIEARPITTVPAFEFASRWDAGTAKIGPAGTLSAGPGLRLVSGIDLAIPQLDREQIVSDHRGRRRLS